MLPGEWEVVGGYVAPWSYCSVKFGMAMFRDAHHYFMMVSKNVEAYAELAKPQILDIARNLRYDFRSSNGQIRRVLGLSQYEIDSIFPLAAAR